MMRIRIVQSTFYVSLLLFRCCCFAAVADQSTAVVAAVVAADQSTAIVAVAGIKRIDPDHRCAADHRRQSESAFSLLFFRCCNQPQFLR